MLRSASNGKKAEFSILRHLKDNARMREAVRDALEVERIEAAARINDGIGKPDLHLIAQKKTKRGLVSVSYFLSVKSSERSNGASTHCGCFHTPADALALAPRLDAQGRRWAIRSLHLGCRTPWDKVETDRRRLHEARRGSAWIPSRAIARHAVCGHAGQKPHLIIIANNGLCHIGPPDALIQAIPSYGAELRPSFKGKTYASFHLGDYFSLKRNGGSSNPNPNALQLMMETYAVSRAVMSGDLPGWQTVQI